MAAGIARLFNSGYRYLKWIGLKETTIFIVCRFLQLKIVRKIKIRNEIIFARTATPDVGIVIRCLTGEQFGNVKYDNPQVIIDAGAYIGASALYFSKKYPKAKVFAIEPEAENFEILCKNIAGYRNIIPIKAAIWGETQTRDILTRFTGPWGFTISKPFDQAKSTGQQIDCITITTLLKNYRINSIDILKIDIEGAEKNVFENSEDWIDKVQLITAELHDRICAGCEKAFYDATRNFSRFEKKGKSVTAFRV